MKKTLTIIVPSYNTENYIEACIPTMLRHTQTASLELLLVNDGSQDGTGEKLEYFSRKYPDTVTVIHKENGGHGSAINIGIQKAQGAYLKVIDGDDWVIAENLGKMLCQLKQCRADMVIHPYIQYDVRKRKGKTIRYNIAKHRELFFDQTAAGLSEVTIQAATYRTALLRENHIRVRERCFYEDTEYNLYPIRYVETVCAYNDPVYIYRMGTVSQSVAPQQAFRNREMHRMVIEDCIAYYQRYGREMSKAKQIYLQKIIKKRIRSQYMIYLKNHINAAQMKELIWWDEELKKNCPFFYRQSGQFPVSILRADIRHMYPLFRHLYAVYAKMV